jgi:hypothetical protein
VRRSSAAQRSLALVIACATLVRLRGIWGVVDVDTDAYGHAVVARRMIDHPTDLAVHWVWLPLWHCVHALFELVGAGFEAVRALSFSASIATVALVFVCVYREFAVELDPETEPLALLSATVSAAALAFAPHAIESSVSAEPEATFALWVFGAFAALRWRRPWLAGALLSLAALTRYEAWPLIAAVFALDVALRARREPGVTAAWALPAVMVALWCAAHRAHSGQWLWFVRENRAFVAHALPRLVPVLPPIERRVLWYPITIPWIDWGALPLLASVSGFALWLRERRWPWVLAPAAIVAFVSFAWVRGQHLGLVRHAVSYLSFYALAMGAGLFYAQKRLAIRLTDRWRLVFVCASIGWFALRGVHAAGELRVRAEARLSRDVAAAAALAHAGRSDVVFCDNAVVEVLSRLHRSQFIRWSAADIRPANIDVEQRRHGAVWVVSKPANIAAIDARCERVFESPSVIVLRARPSEAPSR